MQKIKSDPKYKLSFYTCLPLRGDGNLDYDTFKTYSLKRLKVLRMFENNIKDFDEIQNADIDAISHFCLRLLASQAKWSLLWFLNLETAIFKHRIDKKVTDEEFETFYEKQFQPFLNLERNETKIGQECHFNPNFQNSNRNEIQSIHFTKCSSIIGKRRRDFILEKGYLPLNRESKIAFLVSEFRNYLESRLNHLYDQIKTDADERLIKLNIDLFTITSTPKGGSTNESIQNIVRSPDLPLCIRLLISNMEKSKHAKFEDRQLITLFLKEVGVPINETMQYLRAKLPTMKENELTYMVRYNYGLEGKRADFSCYSCRKIFSLSTDPNFTGCPFLKNKDFVRQFVDIEDSDSLGNCRKYLATLVKSKDSVDKEKPLSPSDIYFSSPDKFFKTVEKLTKEYSKKE